MLKDDPHIIREYENYHAHPWPEVVEGALKCGIRRKIYQDPFVPPIWQNGATILLATLAWSIDWGIFP